VQIPHSIWKICPAPLHNNIYPEKRVNGADTKIRLENLPGTSPQQYLSRKES